MSNSSLVAYTKISPNRTSPRSHRIDTITIHCVVGQVTAESLGEVFAKKSRRASSNYGVDKDGRIGLYCEEKDRSWCSSSSSNDNRAITIEVASDTKPPYAVTDKAFNSLIELCADICKRNNIKQLLWKADKSLVGQVDKQNMTVHRWFANKDCPGEYLYSRHGEIARRVNEKLGKDTPDISEPAPVPVPAPGSFVVKVLVDDLNIRKEPKMGDNVVGVTGKGLFTITEVKNGFGKLLSGAGWIYIDNPKYCEKSIPGKSNEQKKTIDEIAKEVIQGKWGTGQNRKNRLTQAGYDYNAVQKRVNQLM